MFKRCSGCDQCPILHLSLVKKFETSNKACLSSSHFSSFWFPGQLLSFQLWPWAPSHRLILIALRSSSSTTTSITAGTSQLKQSGIMRTVLHVCLSVHALKLSQVSFIFYLVCVSQGLVYAPVCFLFVLICVCLFACLFYQLVFNRLHCRIVSSRGWHKATCEKKIKITWTTNTLHMLFQWSWRTVCMIIF